MSEFHLLLWVVAALQVVTVSVLAMALGMAVVEFGASSATICSLSSARATMLISR